MILYNVTVNIDESVHDEWLDWMKKVHIPNVLRTGIFSENRLLKVLVEEEMGGITYAFQYTCESMEKFREYEQKFAPALRAEVDELYSGKYVAFRTLLEYV
ncbi:MAG: hypothetical protein RIQ47_1873 [Bacteroidota bacterium]|jgi:hypothetical protein